MALIPKTAVLRLRLEPDLFAKLEEMADFHRVSMSALVREWAYFQTARFESLRTREKRTNDLKAMREEIQEGPDAFKLEKSPAKAPKAPVPTKNRAQRRAEAKNEEKPKIRYKVTTPV